MPSINHPTLGGDDWVSHLLGVFHIRIRCRPWTRLSWAPGYDGTMGAPVDPRGLIRITRAEQLEYGSDGI